MTDLCVCGHPRERCADPAGGDTRCLVVAARTGLVDVFDDGRRGELAYCGCLRFDEAATPPVRP